MSETKLSAKAAQILYQALTKAARAGILTKANPPEKPDS